MKRRKNHAGVPAKRQKTAPRQTTRSRSHDAEAVAALISSGSHQELEEALAALGEKETRELFQHERLRLSLHVAYWKGSTPVLQCLLRQRCVSLEERDEIGRTVLYRAVADNKLHLLQLFLQHGADVRWVDSGLSACNLPLLHAALKHVSLEVFKVLVEAGADIYSSYTRGSSALFLAMYLRHESAVEYLLSRNTKKRDFRFLQACSNTFTYALKYRVSEIVALLWPFRPMSGPSRMTLFQRALFAYRDSCTAEVIMERSSRSEQILQHELTGVKRVQDKGSSFHALPYWKTAMCLRWDNPRRPVLKKVPPNSVADLIGTREVQSREELAAMAVTFANIQIQALLIVERIMPASKEYPSLLMEVARQIKDGEKARALLCRAISAVSECSLELREKHDFVVCILEIHLCALHLSYSHFSFSDMLSLLETLVYMFSRKNLCRWIYYKDQRRADVYMLRCLRHMLLLQATATVPEQQRLTRMLTSYILARKPHVLSMFSSITQFSYDVHTVETLVHVSACVSGICSQENYPIHLVPDEHRETPLHHLARRLNKSQLCGKGGAISLFLQHGADLCSKDDFGRRISDILEGRGILEYRPPSLKCLAARVVRQQEGDTVVGRQDIPHAVQNFIMEH